MVIRTIQAACSSSTFFERKVLHHTDAECRLGDPLLSDPSNTAFAVADLTTAVRSFTLPNVVLDADRALLFQDDTVIAETSYFLPDDDRPQVDQQALSHQPDGEDYIIGYNKVYRDYQHWLTQCLPAIDWCLRQPRSRPPRLVVPPLEPWQEDCLSLLGHGTIARLVVRPGRVYHLPQAEYAEFLNGSTSFSVSRSGYATARRLLDRVPATRQETHPILFVPCSNPYYGTIANEAEVIDFFRRRGAFIVDPTLSMIARINLFSNAEVVIGPLGQGMCDVLFTRPGTLFWEWMPRHHQNPSIFCLAQAARADYWGDVFESAPGSGLTRPWSVDLDLVKTRMAEISGRLAQRAASGQVSLPPVRNVTGIKPIGEVMLAFESLGDNCELGLVQRHAGVEPLGLLRFAGTHLSRLIDRLDERLDGVGEIENLSVFLGSDKAPREFLIRESTLGSIYHTFVHEGALDPDALRTRQARQLSFLRRKMLEDLASGEKIWVWRELDCDDPARIWPLMEKLRAFGPNRLLWVTAQDAEHAPGTIERLAPDFIRGYVERLAPYENATDIHCKSWFMVCETAYHAWHPADAASSPVQRAAVVPVPVQAAPVHPAPVHQAPVHQAPAQADAPPRPLTAFDRLRINPPPATAPAPAPPQTRRWFSWLGL